MSSLAGKTIFITGASRGIGEAMATRFAADGANIVIAAKTAEPHPKLPGTIYSAAEAVEKAGGKALPLVVDIRDEQVVEAAVAKAVDHFGGIDICINNASAISLTGTLATPMKRFDLMHQVNARGTYLVSRACMPHLLQAENPHILMNSPPLSMKTKWFENHTGYTMAKYGMSMCVLGFSGEFRGKIGVNALWPRTAVATSAMRLIAGSDAVYDQCRKAEIMADAAYLILTSDAKTTTGNFYIDDEVLTAHGVTDLDQYKVDPDATLLPDFFVD